ncbi:hypothetical protein [Streptomyces sp. ICBB 8177]|uniref:hypothetical protein n=1 Tax=Streptomyces sp. ICBB 8177 TaxID=563922 RepID=UPI001F5418D7|nr:hypothetical protein [Streptomyces sp. ICBB 8177]
MTVSPWAAVADPAVRDDGRGSTEQQRWASLAHRVKGGAGRVAGGAVGGLLAVSERLIDLAPRIPVRDLETLRRHFPGLGPDELADKLVSGATAGTAAVGAGVGAAAMLPVPPAMMAELAAETLAVAAVEYKLIAELHEVYGVRAPGNARARVTAYLGAWAQERGIEVTRPSSVDTALSGRMKRRLRQRLLRRTVRGLPTLTPFMIGAGVGATFNRRDTRRLARRVRDDLRARRVPWDALPPSA